MQIDPCCGSGGMFVQSYDFIKNHSGNIKEISVYGQEGNPTTRKLARMNLAIRGIEANLGQYHADTFFNDQHPQLKAQFIMANPPFNIKKWGADKLTEDKRFIYGSPSDSNANFTWVQHMVHHLASDGKMGMVLANGSLSSQTNDEGKVRENLVEADLVECIIVLPTQLFFNTPIPSCLWFLGKNKKAKGKTLFIDARNMGTMIDRKNRELTTEDIQKLADTYEQYENGTLENELGFCAVVPTEEIAKQDYILTSGRYVGLAEVEEDSEPFEEKMGRLTSDMYTMFDDSHQLEDVIREKMGGIGF